jgi:hypothetical protein
MTRTAAGGSSCDEVSTPTAAPSSEPQADTTCPPYPEALYYWAWSHGAYFGTDPTAPQPSGRTVALIIGALVAATSIATGLLFGLAYDPGSTPTPAIDPGPVAATLQHPAVPASPDTGGATGIVGS